MTDESARDDETLYEIAVEGRRAVSKQFDDFRAALNALCVEHGIRLTGSRDYDDYSTYLEIATDANPAGCEIDLTGIVPPTPEEQAELDRLAEVEAARQKAESARYDELLQKRAEWMASPEFAALSAENQRQANLNREYNMRVSTDPTDPAYIDERPRRVWVNNVEVLGWTVADEFRRCVIVSGKVINGAVLIERLDEPGAPAVESPAECSTSLAGMFVPVPKPTVEVVEAPAPTFAVPTVPVKPAAMSAKKRKKVR